MDKYNDGPFWLRQDNIAGVVKEAIHYRDGKEYDLISYTIMPNHVHLIFTPITVGRYLSRLTLENVGRSEASTVTKKEEKNRGRSSASPYIVTKILQDLKSKTALKANAILNRSGAFWQHESYDHVVRNEEELYRLIEYVLNNPVKAGFADDWKKWKWNYCKLTAED